ncbi:MAG: BrnT family toxin [Candidatus Nomurabacteria bacterium]|jgi:uncharacterized DUF497 family protein|nr:BrnT family toxin [Candidatus Nomurabacteria bacterium]
MIYKSFEWDEAKEALNIQKHNVSFKEATKAFLDGNRYITKDVKHSGAEKRWFCFGKTQKGILTVRFTYREERVRIFGAGYWRNGIKKYERRRNERDL